MDTNILMFALGREHPLRAPAVSALAQGVDEGVLATSAEVLQELLHVYLRTARLETFDEAVRLVAGCISSVWTVEAEDITQARALADVHPGLAARDLVHLACCQRRGVRRILTFDRSLHAAAKAALRRAADPGPAVG